MSTYAKSLCNPVNRMQRDFAYKKSDVLIEYGFFERLILMRNHRCADRIAGDIDCGSCHVKDTVP